MELDGGRPTKTLCDFINEVIKSFEKCNDRRRIRRKGIGVADLGLSGKWADNGVHLCVEYNVIALQAELLLLHAENNTTNMTPTY